jgi:hypothetical protein
MQTTVVFSHADIQVSMVKGKNPRFDLLRGGEVVETHPATRQWRSEQTQMIEKARSLAGLPPVEAARPQKPTAAQPQSSGVVAIYAKRERDAEDWTFTAEQERRTVTVLDLAHMIAENLTFDNPTLPHNRAFAEAKEQAKAAAAAGKTAFNQLVAREKARMYENEREPAKVRAL